MAIYSPSDPPQGGEGTKRQIFKKIGKKKGNKPFFSKFIKGKVSKYKTFKGRGGVVLDLNMGSS